MAQVIARRPVLYWLIAVLIGVLVGIAAVDRVSAAPAERDGKEVEEQNLDENGNIKVHEQGVVPVTDNDGSLTVDGTVNVSNLPAERILTEGSSIGIDLDTFPDESVFEVSEGVIVTDVLGSFRGQCEFLLTGSESTSGFSPTVYREFFDDGGNVTLNFTTGFEASELIVRSRSTGTCGGEMAYFGYFAP